MGLLDFLQSDEAQMGLGLLGAAGPRSDGAGFGQRLQEGLGYVQAQKDAAMKRQFMAAQMDNYASEIEARKLAGVKDARQQAMIENLFGGTMGGQPDAGRMPAQPGAGGGAANAGGGSLMDMARRMGIPEKAIQADMAFNGGKGIADMLFKRGTPDMQVTNGYAYDKNSTGPGFMPSLSTSQDGKTSMVRIGPDGLPVVGAPRGAMETFAGYQGAQASFRPIKIFNPATGREEYTNEGAVVGGQSQGGGAQPGYANEPQMKATVGGGMGQDPQALAREIKATQNSLMQPGLDANSKAMLQGHLNSLLAQGGRPAPGNFAAGPSAAEAAASAAAVTQANANVKPLESRNNALAQTNYMIKAIDGLLKHPGLETGTGLSGAIDPRNYIPGTDAKNFGVALEQVKGGTFLQAFEGLKGSGGVTEIEGTKATNAIARLNSAQSSKEFKAALTDFSEVMTGVQARQKAAMPGGNQAAEPDKPKVQGTAFDTKPPAHQFKGKTATGPDGKRYKSDGMIWKEVQ